MRAAAKQLEFERAAALRDEIQEIRLRVLEEDASMTVGRAAERAAAARGTGLDGAADRGAAPGATRRRGERRGSRSTSVEVLPADEEPVGPLDADGHDPLTVVARGCSTEETRRRTGARHPRRARGRWLAGAWLDRPTWDRTVTPNVRRRTGTRAAAGPRRRTVSNPVDRNGTPVEWGLIR